MGVNPAAWYAIADRLAQRRPLAAVPSRRVAGGSSPIHTVPSIQADKVSLQYESFGNPADPSIVLVMGLGMH